MNVGEKIKQLRLQKNMTIKDLAEKTGLSSGSISNVERSLNSPTISYLQKICAAFDTDIADLFTPPKSNSIIVRKNERQSFPLSASRLVTGEIVPMKRHRLQPSFIDIQPKGKYGYPALIHDGEEICLILEGSVEFWTGDECHHLMEGDCIYVESKVPHRLLNRGETVVKTFWVTINGEGDFRPDFNQGQNSLA